jgi:hypothetical protein
MTEQTGDKEDGRWKRFWITWRGWVLLALFLLVVVVVLERAGEAFLFLEGDLVRLGLAGDGAPGGEALG